MCAWLNVTSECVIGIESLLRLLFSTVADYCHYFMYHSLFASSCTKILWLCLCTLHWNLLREFSNKISRVKYILKLQEWIVPLEVNTCFFYLTQHFSEIYSACDFILFVNSTCTVTSHCQVKNSVNPCAHEFKIELISHKMLNHCRQEII